MPGRLFGTDGIRGLANAELTPELALAVSAAAVSVLGGERPLVVVGRDTRPSGELLEAAVIAGLTSAGADVDVLGIVSTPAVAHALAAPAAPRAPTLGVMISASHNPMPDNGIKFFGAGGFKLPDAVEDAIEAAMGSVRARPTGTAVGRPSTSSAGGYRERYRAALLEAAPVSLCGLKVVADCAYGSASALAPEVLERAGAEVVALHVPTPLGPSDRINHDCGATSLDRLRAAVVAHGADLGVAFDGDADRCLAVDAAGAVVDGDQILAICAVAAHSRGELVGGAVVATVMANLGFHHAMRAAGIRVVTTGVGDRYVLEAMQADGLVLGGEQSGHTVFLDRATTGDGLLTALRLLGEVVRAGRPLAELAGVMRRLPQVLVNCRAERALAGHEYVTDAVAKVSARFGDTGRVLVRPSGTEALVRVMVEAPSPDDASAAAAEICAALERAAAVSAG